MTQDADAPPFHGQLSEGPEGGETTWVHTEDGVRLRIGFWPHEGALGTVLIFPGRTEYIEKYGRVANDLREAGFAAAAVDWRGQGMSDRLHDDPSIGHVDRFADYQKDVAAFIEGVEARALPRPFFLIAHSMGGCIGLRALIEGLPVERAVFSAPMWGIHVAPRLRPVAALVPPIAKRLGMSKRYTPGTRPTAYVSETEFQANLLTTDPDHYAYLSRQAQAEKGFALGGPSLNWFGEAVQEAKTLAALPRPRVKSLTFVGTAEEVVSSKAIDVIHKDWPDGTLRRVDGAKHELMMEAPPLRAEFMDGTIAFFKDAL